MNQSYTHEIIDNYRIICQAEPKNIENWLVLGRYLVDIQAYEEAEEALTKIFEEGRFFSFRNGLPLLRLKTLFKWRKNKHYFAKAYTDLAAVSIHHGNLAEAERLLTMALTVFEKIKNDEEYARAANRLGMVYRLAGAFESAEELHYRAKSLAEKHGWSFVLAETLGNLGMVYEGKDHFAVALEHHQDALNLYLKDEKHSFEAACQYRQLGLCLLRWGRGKEAAKELSNALKSFEKQDNLLFQSRVLNDIAMVYQEQHDLEKAVETCFKALEVARRTEDKIEIAENALLCGTLRIEAGKEDEETGNLLKEALAVFQDLDKKLEVANASATLGLLYLHRQEWEKAESLFRQSLRIEERLHRSLGMASDYSNLGLIAQKRGDDEKAALYWDKAASFFELSGEEKRAMHFRDLCRRIISDRQEALLREE